MVLLLVFLSVHYPGSLNVFNLYQSKSLPYPSKIFVGREQEMLDLSDFLDFSHSDSDIRIVNLVGSPGFGKSTLAIHVGNRLVQQGIEVHYVNLAEYQEQKVQQTLAEKILKVAGKSTKMVSFDKLLVWLRRLFWNSVIILDNCDDILQRQKVKFFNTVKLLVEQTRLLKVVITSREVTTQIEYFKRYPVYELSTRAACELLNKKLPPGASLTSSEVEEIAKLTGNAPLALQIVGALWTLPNPPSPSVIIKELQQRPIPLLSQDEFEYKINVSIDLSYRYLSFEMQKIGRYLANFPGSFDESAAIFIHAVLNGVNDNMLDSVQPLPVRNITATLNSLIHRSLIEFDSRTQRYQFHRLIKEFFREKQMSVGEIGQNETKRFTRNFRIYYSQQLESCSGRFETDYKQALVTFHTERHNFKKLLDDLITNSYTTEELFLQVMTSILNAITRGILHSSFTDEELVHPLQSALKYFDELILQSLSTTREVEHGYIVLLYQLSGIEERLYGPEKAVEMCQLRECIIDNFTKISSTLTYQNFYEALAKYHTALDNHEEAILSHVKSLSARNNNLRSQCFEHTQRCSYYELGKLLYASSDFEESAQAFESSYKHEQHLGLQRLFFLFHVIRVYTDLKEPTKVDLYTEEFNKVAQQEIDVNTPSQLFATSVDIQIMIFYFRRHGEVVIANMLEGKLLEAIIEIGAQPRVLSTPLTTLEVVKEYYKASDYDKTIQLARFLLDSLHHLREQHHEVEDIQLKTQVLIAKAKFHSGNYSQGMDDMEVIRGSILNQTEKLYEKELSDACLYLIPRLKYITTCYPTITLVAVKLPVAILFELTVYIMFRMFKVPVSYIILSGIPLDPYSVRVSEFCYMYKLIPELEWHSRSTDLTVTQRYPVQQLLVDIPYSLFKQIKPAILSHLSWYFHDCVCFILQFPIVCFILNVLFVFVRLYIALLNALISCIMLFNVPYMLLVRLAIIVPLYRLFFKYPEYFIFPPTIMLLNVVFFIDTVIDVILLAYCSCIFYLITGFNLFSFSVSKGLYGFMYQFD